MTSDTYLLAGRRGELERLQLQSRVWEPAGRRLLNEIGEGQGLRAVDIGCGAMGWLRLLSEWVGPDGQVVGTDVQDDMLQAAGQFLADEALGNVTLITDDLFASELEPASFDLVHARAQIGPLGRADDQMATYLRLVRPGGVVVLEDVDPASWHFLPPAPACEELVPLLAEAFGRAGGEPYAGTTHLHLFRNRGITPQIRAEVQALPPGHPYNRVLLQFVTALDGLLRSFVDPERLGDLRNQAEQEVQEPDRWGVTPTLIQSWGRLPA